MDLSVSLKDQIWFLRVCHHVSNVLYREVITLPLQYHTVHINVLCGGKKREIFEY